MSKPYPAYGNPPHQVGESPYMYPPENNSSSQYPFSDYSTTTTLLGKPAFNRPISRTPSPTPSEAAELARASVFNWKSLSNWRTWLRREWLWYYVIAIILGVITALVTIYHHQIVVKLTPVTHWIKSLPGGWAIPIAILFILSFPPLFGHEIVAILCGIVWGLWIGFAIVAAGTFVGEMGNFYAFKYLCRARGEKLEKTNIRYGCLARVVREGGFKIALIARFSVIPGHFTTAVFASCGMSVWTFALAAFLSLPKQFATVYIGVIIDGAGSHESTAQRIASYSLIVVTTIVTFLAAWYIFRELNRVKPNVIYDRRKARQAKMEESTMPYHSRDVSSVSTFNPDLSDSDIPLRSYDPERDPSSEGTVHHQRWDERGQAFGYAPDPRLHSPTPRLPSFKASAALYASPNAAAAATSSSSGGAWDEWTNALTPNSALPPDLATMPTPASAPINPPREFSSSTEYAPTSAPATFSIPPPQRSPHSGHARPSTSSTTVQNVTQQPEENFAVSTAMSSKVAPGSSDTAPPSFPNPHATTRTFSPPPSYS